MGIPSPYRNEDYMRKCIYAQCLLSTVPGIEHMLSTRQRLALEAKEKVPCDPIPLWEAKDAAIQD